jgi:hypothetical protein
MFKENLIFDVEHFSIPDEILNHTNVWELDKRSKQALYKFWLSLYLKKQQDRNPLPQLCQQYDEICNERKMLEEELQVEVLSRTKLIGKVLCLCSNLYRNDHHWCG